MLRDLEVEVNRGRWLGNSLVRKISCFELGRGQPPSIFQATRDVYHELTVANTEPEPELGGGGGDYSNDGVGAMHFFFKLSMLQVLF